MRKRGSKLSKGTTKTFGMAKSFHAPQKDSSKRAKKNFGPRKHDEQKED